VELGADVEETTMFFAYGMLINTLASMGFPPEHRNWEGFYDSAQPPAGADGGVEGEADGGARKPAGPSKAVALGRLEKPGGPGGDA
jgi:hypothetical protein